MPISDNILRNNQITVKFRHISTHNFTDFYHYHRGIEILFVHQGKGHLVLNRKVYTLEAGCIHLIQPFQLHRVHFEVSENCPYERSVITFEPTSFLTFFKGFPSILHFYEHMWKDELSNQVFHMSNDSVYILSILERLNKKLSERHGEDHIEAALMIVAVFDYLHSLNEVSTHQAVPRPERYAEKIMQWVEDHYTEPFNLDELAKELHISRHHVSHLFQTETGSSISDYVIARRIRQACWLLKTESLSIEFIGLSVGIPHFSYFCRLFKRITGLTPKQYRNSSI
ncbi:AraC family transcriptional regulator [Paenibacillus sp. LMG 31456]|uniref:AraC family transcriptional regulator n=1 Tax=Paenibacillus foliorum TaxID=2654974 RepID=A0A972K0Z0_9BACL|nr:AraC family transcriptional regulator [Paenibacillus foliorum]NOU94315.1 AraC family transcriptional regulator [Paenibacillus foliorum]